MVLQDLQLRQDDVPLSVLTVELWAIRELIVLYLAIFKLFPNSKNCVVGEDFKFNERGRF